MASKIVEKIFIDTLGCAKNEYDSFKIKENLFNAGYQIVDDPKDSQLIILNTCAFIQPATQESIDTFFEYKNAFRDKLIVVVGCLVSRYTSALKKALPEADLFLECNCEDDIVEQIQNISAYNKFNRDISNFWNSNLSYRYIKISDGCNRYCSYCTIPFIRGKYRSTRYSKILTEVNDAVKKGIKEIILVAQDCGVWGSDLKHQKDLSWLLDKLATEFNNTWFRVLYIQPDAINDKLIRCFAKHDNICNYFDIPMQHVNKDILKSMNRIGDREYYLKIIHKIKSILPDACIRTTFIVGYPSESDSNFNELCDFVSLPIFDYVSIFKFYSEEGTKASKMDGQISEETKDYRFRVIRDICDTYSTNKMEDNIGKVYGVIIDDVENGLYYGRNQFLAPDIDSVIYVDSKNKLLNIGDIVKVKIVDTQFYDYKGILQ